jgi:ubiquinone/menaquinone biosynthesis C-methylase UbiE
MIIESKVSLQYDRLAVIYDRRWGKYLSNTLSLLTTYLQVSQHLSGTENILDIACGTGELERLLLNTHSQLKIVGVDISEKMLGMARLKLPDLEFIKASAIALPFPDCSFDMAITVSAFHYFDRPIAALVEIRRILKPEGKLIVMDWCRDYWFCQAFDLFLKIFDPAHKECYNQKELRSFLTASGFDILDEKKQKLGVFWGMMIATGATPPQRSPRETFPSRN